MTEIRYIRNEMLFCDTGENLEGWYRTLKDLDILGVVKVISIHPH